MCANRATLQHLQGLQTSRLAGSLLDAAPTPSGMGAGFAEDGLEKLALKEVSDLRPIGLFDGCDDAGPERLREMVNMASFWISFLEGEHHCLLEEVAKLKQRHQEMRRQAEAKAIALRESDVEKKQLQSQLKVLQQSRDEAICDRAVLRQQDGSRVKNDVDSRIERIEEERDRDRKEKSELEELLVKNKMRYAETLQKAEFYEDQLRAVDPDYDVYNATMGGSWVPRIRHIPPAIDPELESNHSHSAAEQQEPEEKAEKAPKVKKGLKGGLSMVRSFLKVKKKDEDDASDTGQSSRRSSNRTSSNHPPVPAPAGGSGSGSGQAVELDGSAPTNVSSFVATSPVSDAASSRPKKRWEMRMAE